MQIFRSQKANFIEKDTACGRAAMVKNTAEPKDESGPAARCKDVAKKMLLKREK